MLFKTPILDLRKRPFVKSRMKRYYLNTMGTSLKIINSLLILFAFYMGMKQGWAMISGKADMLDMFSKWNVGKTGVMVFGVVTMISAVMILIPKTFIAGNFLMAASILLIICFHLIHRDLKGVAIELPFFLLNWIIIYLQHPLNKEI